MARSAEHVHRCLLAFVGVLLVATITSMAMLWPSAGELPSTDGQEASEELIAGEVVEVRRTDPAPARGRDPTSGPEADRMLLIEVRLIEGEEQGRIVEVEVPVVGFPEIEVGDQVTMARTDAPDGGDQYYIADFERIPALAWLFGLFVAAVLVVSRWHGLRSLLGLGISLLIIVEFVVPAILAGGNPALIALVGAVAVMIVTLYLTHGVTAMTTAAVVGTTAALAVTVGLGIFFIQQSKITGFSSEDAVFARFAVDGALDLQGLVLAGLIIAALGVLDDVTISQSSTVFALHETDRSLTWRSLVGRAMVVGRDHIASVVNTLFLAYAGASLALLVLFSTGGLSGSQIVNSEILAEEIVKTIVGSMGLILAVPFTTALAATVAIAGREDRQVRTVDEPVRHDGELDDEARAARAWAAYLHRRRENGGGDSHDGR